MTHLEKEDIIPLVFLAELVIVCILWYILDSSGEDVLGYQSIMGLMLWVSFELWLYQDKIISKFSKDSPKNNFQNL